MALKQAPDALYKAYRAEPTLRPTAQPVDTFVRSYADPTAGSELTQLAKSLEALQPQLNMFFDDKREKAQEAELAEGRKAYEENKLKWQEYLKEHPEQRGYSPHFQKGYRGMWLREQARKFNADLNDAYNKGATVDVNGVQTDVRTVEDAQAFENWKADFKQEWYKKNLSDVDPTEFNDSFLPIAEEGASYLTANHIKQRAAAYDAGYKDKFSNEVIEYATGITDTPEFDTAEGRAAAVQSVGNFITERTNAAITEGLLPQEANDLAVDGLIKAAGTVGGEEGLHLLESLQYAKAGTGIIGKIGKYKVAIDKAKDAISEDYMNLEMKKYQYNQILKKQSLNNVMDKLYPDMWENPSSNWTSVIADVSRKYGWEAADEVRSTLNSIRGSYELDSTGKPKKTGGSESSYNTLANLYTVESMYEEGQCSAAEAQQYLNSVIASGSLSATHLKQAIALKSKISKGEKSDLSKEVKLQMGLLKPNYLGEAATPEQVAYFNRLSNLATYEISKVISKYPEGSPERDDAIAVVMEKLTKKYPGGDKLPPLVTDKPTGGKDSGAGGGDNPKPKPTIYKPKPAALAPMTIEEMLSPSVKASAINYKSERMFYNWHGFVNTIKTWADNPHDPNNTINRISKKLGIKPVDFLKEQAVFYATDNGDSLFDLVSKFEQ